MVKEVFPHEDYNATTHENDIALIKLRKLQLQLASACRGTGEHAELPTGEASQRRGHLCW